MFRRILVLMDGSEHGVEALRTAVILAQRTGAELLTLYVRPNSTSIEEANADADAEAHIQHAVAELCGGGLRVNCIFGTGKPQDGILAASLEQHPSLVILCPHSGDSRTRRLPPRESHRHEHTRPERTHTLLAGKRNI